VCGVEASSDLQLKANVCLVLYVRLIKHYVELARKSATIFYSWPLRSMVLVIFPLCPMRHAIKEDEGNTSREPVVSKSVLCLGPRILSKGGQDALLIGGHLFYSQPIDGGEFLPKHVHINPL